MDALRDRVIGISRSSAEELSDGYRAKFNPFCDFFQFEMGGVDLVFFWIFYRVGGSEEICQPDTFCHYAREVSFHDLIPREATPMHAAP